MLPREWKADRRARRACDALGKTFDKRMHGAAAGFRMIKETSAAGKLLKDIDALEAGLRVGNDCSGEKPNMQPQVPPISPLVGEMSAEPTEGGGDGATDTAVQRGRGGTAPPSALPGISPTRGEIGERRGPSAPDLAGGPKSADVRLHSRRQLTRWHFTGRLAQMPPPGDWRVWLLMGGRGSGKTRAGAEWVQALALSAPDLRIALVAETLGDGREVMIDGVSGICRIAGRARPEFEASRRRLVWPNGSIAQIFSSEDPESLRGPQFHFAWCDELGKWKHAQ